MVYQSRKQAQLSTFQSIVNFVGLSINVLNQYQLIMIRLCIANSKSGLVGLIQAIAVPVFMRSEGPTE
jgi:hypothetical protein